MADNQFDSLKPEQKAAVNAKIIDGFAHDEKQLDRYSDALRKIKDPQERAQKFDAMLAEDRERLAGDAHKHPENYQFNPTEGLSKSRPVLLKIQEVLVGNVDKNAKDYPLEQMEGIVNSLRRQFNYGEEKTITKPRGVCVGPSVDMSEDITPPPPSGHKEPSCGTQR